MDRVEKEILLVAYLRRRPRQAGDTIHQEEKNERALLYRTGRAQEKHHLHTYTIKTPDGARIEQARLPAQRAALRQWAAGLERPFVAALEATLFSGWVWDELQPYAQELQPARRRKSLI